MIAMKRSCLDREELQLVLSGRLSIDDFESAISHLDDCQQCRSAAESFQQDGQWMIEALDGNPDPLQSETECQIALWQVLETPEYSESATDDAGALPLETLGPYRLIRALGSGGMGTVYLAEHIRLKRHCAIKILPRDRVDQPGWLERFDREMTTIASLEHPNVVRATDAGHQDGWHFLVMEHLDGMDVGGIASRLGQLEVADACDIAGQAALGLAHVHAAGLVHRDIKPSNLMLSRKGEIKLLDLGLVLSGDDPLSVDDRLTTVGHLMGTLPYMAPEQLMDSRDVDSRADLYALGATLYRLIAGKPPHQRRGGLATQVMAITNQDAPTLDSVRDDVDKELVGLVAQMLSRDPAARPQTADEVASRLARFGSSGQLRRLVRNALRRSSPEPSSRSSLQLRTDMRGVDTPRQRSWRSRLGAGMVALAVFVALSGYLLKIATDRGELVFRIGQPGVVIAVRQGDEVIDHLQLEIGADNRVTLRKGTYILEIENPSGELVLEKDVVTIGRGTTEEIKVIPESATRVYQGKNLAAWMSSLSREEDPITLGRIMHAVEVLTRGTDERGRAAKATLHTARLWGGFKATSSTPGQVVAEEEPSAVYMGFLNNVFPEYGEDGLKAIDFELDQGNTLSRTAAIWLLQRLSREPFTMPPKLVDHLKKASAALRVADVDNADYIISAAKEPAIIMLVREERPIAGQPWLEEYVRDSVAAASDLWRDDGKSLMGYGFPIQWLVDEEILFAAVQLEAEASIGLDWDWAASVLLQKQYHRRSRRTDVILDAVANHASAKLVEAISARLQEMTIPFIDASDAVYGVQGPADSFWSGREWISAFELATENSVWPKALALYADQSAHPVVSLDLLERIRQNMVASGAEREHRDRPFQWLDDATRTLEKRISQSPARPKAD